MWLRTRTPTISQAEAGEIVSQAINVADGPTGVAGDIDYFEAEDLNYWLDQARDRWRRRATKRPGLTTQDLPESRTKLRFGVRLTILHGGCERLVAAPLNSDQDADQIGRQSGGVSFVKRAPGAIGERSRRLGTLGRGRWR